MKSLLQSFLQSFDFILHNKVTAMNNMNNTSHKDSGYLESGEHHLNAGSTPLLQTTDLEQSESRPPEYVNNEQQRHTGFMNMDDEHVPTLEVNKAFDFTGHVDTAFEKIFPEAKGSQVEAVSVCLKTVFNFTQRLVYLALTVIIATFLVLIWGIVFAIVNFLVVWLLQPALKLSFLLMRVSGDLIRVVMNCTLQPLFQAVSMIYSNFRGNFNVNVAAQEPLTTNDLPLPQTV